MAEGIFAKGWEECTDILCRCKVVGLRPYAVKDCPLEFKIVLKACCIDRKDRNKLPIVKIFQRNARDIMKEYPVKITDNCNGTYTVLYVPARGGKIEMHVRITETPIEDSPFGVKCRDYTQVSSQKFSIPAGTKVALPRTIAYGQSHMWAVCDSDHIHLFKGGHSVRKLPCPGGRMQFPAGLEFRGSRRLCMISSIGCAVQEFYTSGLKIRDYEIPSNCPHHERAPPTCAAAIITYKDKLYATDPQNRAIIRVFQLSDAKQCDTMETECAYPAGLAISIAGNLLITDYEQHCIHSMSLTGEHLKKFAEPFDLMRGPKGIATDAYGCVLVCSSGTGLILVFKPNGVLLHSFGTMDIDKGVFRSMEEPSGIAIDHQGRIYVSECFTKGEIKIY